MTEEKMEASNEPINRSVRIAVDNLEDIVLPRLDTLTPAQWTLLSQGLRDSHITGVMADILASIFQRCVESSLTILVPILEDNMAAGASAPDESIRVYLGSLISEEVAAVLEVRHPEDACGSGAELNALMEREVSEKVTSIANGVRRTPSFPSSPAVFAGGCISNLRSFNKMVAAAVQCFRRQVNTPRSRCIERYWSAFTKKKRTAAGTSSDESEMSFDLTEGSVSPVVRSLYSVASVSESITEIIERHSEDAEDGEEDEGSGPEVNEVADGISKTIIDDLHYCKAGRMDRHAPHFNLKKILGDIRDLFRSKGRMSPPATEDIVKKPQFSRFATDQFATMTSSLETSVRDSRDANVVRLKRGRSLSNRLASLVFRGRNPEDPSKVQPETRLDQTPKLDFQSIKPEFDRLCAEVMKNPELNNRVKQFSKDLTDKLYRDITSSHHYDLPVPRDNVSESVLSSETVSDPSGQTEICPEIFYARTEDEVRRFLQTVFLWIRDEETHRISESDRLSDVLSEISDLVGQTYETRLAGQTPTTSEDRKSVTFVQEITAIQITEAAETPEDRMRDLEVGTACFVFRAVLNCSRENGGPFGHKEMRRILRYLSGDRIRRAADFAVAVDNGNNTHFARNLYEALRDAFGSAEGLRAAAMAPDGRAFQAALETHLRGFVPEGRRKTVTQRTASKVRKTVRVLVGNPTPIAYR